MGMNGRDNDSSDQTFQSTYRWGFLKLQLSVETLRSILILHLQG